MVDRKTKTTSEMQAKLAEPFAPLDMEWRVQHAGKSKDGTQTYALLVPYLTNRAIQQRLDDVCGFDGWKNEFADTPNSKGTLCGISIRMPSIQEGAYGDWLTKWDGADDTSIEATKGGLSGAMKRAAVQWGIGRYLYKLDSAYVNFTTINPGKDVPNVIVTQINFEGRKTRIYFTRPTLPDWALPTKA